MELDTIDCEYIDCEYIDCGECCICYDKTFTKTSCNHFLCVECWTKIKNTTECPYCRHKKIKIRLIKKKNNLFNNYLNYNN